MPNLDLAGALQIAINGQDVAEIGHMGATRWAAEVEVGPIRPAIVSGARVGSEGNSQLVTITGPEVHHGGIWDTLRPVTPTFVAGGSLGGINDNGTISDSVWAVNGPGRNADLTGGSLWVNEGLAATQFADGFPDPGTAQDNVTLRYMAGYARTAIRQGATRMVIASNWPHRDFPDYDAPLQHAQFWRAYAEMHTGTPVWIFPTSYMVRDMRAYYALPANGAAEIYADPVHLNNTNYPEVCYALSHAANSFETKALPSAYNTFSTRLRDLFDICWAVLQDYRWAGFGGNEAPADLLYNGAPLSEGNDPLPNPATLPGEPADPTAPPQPAAPSFVNVTDVSADVTFGPLSDGGSAITQVVLEWRPTGGSTTTVTGVTSPHGLTGLAATTAYEARIRADNAIGAGTFSTWSTFTTNAAAPTGPTPLVEITDTSYAGPALSSGALPAGAGGFRTFTPGASDPVASIPVTISGAAYMIARVRSTSFSNLVYMLTLQNGAYGTWPGITMVAYGAANDWVGGIVDSAFNNTNAVSGAGLSGAWQTVEVWSTGATVYISVDGSAPASASTGGTGWTANVLHLFRDEGSGGHTIDMSRARLFDSVPADRAAQQAWAETGA